MFSSSKHNFINDNSTKTGSAKKSALANATLDNDSLEDTCRQNLLAKLWTFIAGHPKSIAAI
ncbi:MAG: enterobactin ABC transporter permease, partial [Psychrobacter sp.]|nr:enterobactin ABC transporter permease [Psychrobacter sp.]